jgi:DNA-binding beta-propeller fold protein YncE
VGSISGEGNYEAIDQAIARTIAEARKRGELNEQPVRLALEKARVGEMPLAFPGKLLADAKSDRLFIADSNHNRIVITKLNGTLIETIGTGTIGAVDGAYDRASFYRPQGLALEGDTLFVADTENHLLREIDLKSRTVKTIAGTGRQSLEYFKSGPARTIGLNSPWDLQLVGSTLYIAMAGPHQIWKYDRERQEISTFAGSGREERTDGPLTEAGFAQPSGLASDGHNLYVADSEANIVRAIDLRPGGGVRTLAGGDLFGFGDKDGEGDSVRLQHPLGLALWNNDVLIADTYNHKIKVLNPKTRQVKSFAGKGKPGQADGPAASFHEPAGLSVANGKLYIADTDNHAIRVVDLQTRVTSTLELKGLLPPSAALSDGEADVTPNAEVIKVEVQKLKLGDKPSLIIDVLLPAGYHLNPAAPQKYRVNVEKGSEAITLRPQEAARTSRDLQFPLQVKLQTAQAGLAELRASVTLYYCRADNTGTCRIKTLVWQIPVEITTVATGQSEIKLKGKILEEGSS